MMEYKSIVLEVTNYVEPTDKYVPLTGVHSVETDIAGWRWDRRRLPGAALGTTRYLTYAGGHDVGLLDGTQLEDWQSGVLDGITYEDIVNVPVGDCLTWTPRFTTGSFSVYWDSRSLYSDHSFSAVANYVAGDLRTSVTLRADAVHDSISARIFSRTATYEIMTVRDIQMVTEFTGVIDSQERVSPGELPDVDWSLVETRKSEMAIDGDALVFNQLFAIRRGVDSLDPTVIADSWENKGAGLANGRALFSKYFPFNAGSVRLVSISSLGVVTEWTEKVNLNFSTATDKHFSVNYDLGVIQTGGYKAPGLVLDEALSISDTEVSVVMSSDLDFYPDQGIIQVGTEQIYYLAKTRKAFIDCVRGYNGTTVAEHAISSILEDVQHGASSTDVWYCKYEAVPRVDYEVSDYALRSANYSTWLDVRALVNVKANNIVQIVSQDTNLAEVVLSTDSEVIGGNLYGPVFFGTDTSKLTATAYDSAGNPVEDIQLTTYIKDGPGFLNGTLDRYSANSNSLGKTNCFFSAPYTQESLDMDVVKIEHVGSDTHMTVNFDTAVVPGEVWVFQVLKHDPTLGSTGTTATAFSSGAAAEPYGLGYIDVWVKTVEDYNNGILRLLDNSGIVRNFGIRQAVRLTDGNDEPYTRFYLDTAVNAGWVGASNSVWLFQEGAVEWDPALKRGARVILYEWRDDVQHPVTKLEGAWFPLHPDEITGDVLVFKDRNLPLPDALDATNNLGAYIVVAPAESRFGAYGRDPFTGSLIVSNDVRLRLQLPNTLVVVDSSGTLPIPYGWTFITEEFNIGAGLGGANFITINPAATGINQFSLTGVI